jgi:hypothetical protein
MARPWPKCSLWPYVAKSGRRSYAIGVYDHERRERSRSFPTVRHAHAWMSDYITAERRGRESLRRFLLDLDAKDANAAEEARTIAEVLELYLALDAHPGNEGGLAPSTYDRYEGRLLVISSVSPVVPRAARSHYPATHSRSRLCPPHASTSRRRRERGVRTC